MNFIMSSTELTRPRWGLTRKPSAVRASRVAVCPAAKYSPSTSRKYAKKTRRRLATMLGSRVRNVPAAELRGFDEDGEAVALAFFVDAQKGCFRHYDFAANFNCLRQAEPSSACRRRC